MWNESLSEVLFFSWVVVSFLLLGSPLALRQKRSQHHSLFQHWFWPRTGIRTRRFLRRWFLRWVRLLGYSGHARTSLPKITSNRVFFYLIDCWGCWCSGARNDIRKLKAYRFPNHVIFWMRTCSWCRSCWNWGHWDRNWLGSGAGSNFTGNKRQTNRCIVGRSGPLLPS